MEPDAAPETTAAPHVPAPGGAGLDGSGDVGRDGSGDVGLDASTDQERPADARVWVEFLDPDEPAQRFRCDLTWLTSGYACIYGRGCPGIDTRRGADGCCGLGAHFCDDDDLARVADVVAGLTADTWQYADARARVLDETAASGTSETADEADGPWWTEPEDGAVKTRVVDGACVLLNRAGFAGGAGCALHAEALRRGVPPLRLKPDVCWQLPLRRDYRTVEIADDTSYLEVTIGEYERGHWGPGGHDFDWYCTASPLAHGHREPLYRSHADELTELMGAAAYEVLGRHCEAHLAAVRAARARPEGRALLDLLVHPATLAARERPAPGRCPSR